MKKTYSVEIYELTEGLPLEYAYNKQRKILNRSQIEQEVRKAETNGFQRCYFTKYGKGRYWKLDAILKKESVIMHIQVLGSTL